MIKDIEALESSLKLEKGSLSKAIESEEEVEIDITGLKINTSADHETLLANNKKISTTIAREELLKEMKEAHGLDYEGRKDPENFVKALTAKVTKDAGIEPDKKLTELQTDFDTLQNNFKSEQTKYNDLIEENKVNKTKNSIDNKIISSIPQNLSISNEDALLLFNSKYKSSLSEDGNLVISKDGVVLKDEIQNNQGIKDIMNDFVTPYLKKIEGGSGGTDDKTKNKPSSMDGFIKRMENEGVKQGSSEFSKRMNAAISDKTLVI